MPQVITCPQCSSPLRVPDTVAPGTQVKCPKCSTPFAVPAGQQPGPEAGQFAAAPLPPMPSFPEPGASPGPGFGPATEPRDPLQRKVSLGHEELSTDYALDLAVIFNRTHAHLGHVIGLMMGYTTILIAIGLLFAIFSIILSLVPVLGTLVGVVISAALFYPLGLGLVIVALAQYRGTTWSFADCFGGFQHWKAIFVCNLLLGLVNTLCMAPSEIVMRIAGADPWSMYSGFFSGNPAIRQPDPQLMLIGQAFQWIGMVIMMVVMIRYFVLANFLIVDRNLGSIEAIKASMALTTGHFWGWLGITLLLGLIYMAGIIACCVGVLFTIPYAVLLMTSAYLQVAGDRRPTDMSY